MDRGGCGKIFGAYRALCARFQGKEWKIDMKTGIQLSDHFTYRKLLRFTGPSIIMMVFTSVYGVVDGFFVSNYAGKTAFAAINLIMPFIMILGGMGFMIGTGGTALVSLVLGQNDRAKANRYFSMMIYLSVIMGIVLSVLGFVFMRPVAGLLGATPEMMEDCVLYGRITIGFITAFMLQNVFQSFLIAAERPKLGLAATVAACCRYCTLSDPIPVDCGFPGQSWRFGRFYKPVRTALPS